MLTIQDVERIFEEHPFLIPPRNVILIHEPIEMLEGYRRLLFAGLTPAWKRDTIILSSLATPETVIHETLHTYGFGEMVAWNLSPIILRFREVFPSIVKPKVKYVKCGGCEEFRVLHEKYSDRAEHWVLQY